MSAVAVILMPVFILAKSFIFSVSLFIFIIFFLSILSKEKLNYVLNFISGLWLFAILFAIKFNQVVTILSLDKEWIFRFFLALLYSFSQCLPNVFYDFFFKILSFLSFFTVYLCFILFVFLRWISTLYCVPISILQLLFYISLLVQCSLFDFRLILCAIRFILDWISGDKWQRVGWEIHSIFIFVAFFILGKDREFVGIDRLCVLAQVWLVLFTDFLVKFFIDVPPIWKHI